MPLTSVMLAGLMNLVQLYLFAISLVFIVLQSITILVSISVDRYIACCHPQFYNHSQRYAKAIISGEIIFNLVSIGVAFNRPIGANIFNYLSRIIICGSFVVIVALYVKIFIVLRRRMTRLDPDSSKTVTNRTHYHQPIPSTSEPGYPDAVSGEVSVQSPPVVPVGTHSIGVMEHRGHVPGDEVSTTGASGERHLLVDSVAGLTLSRVVNMARSLAAINESPEMKRDPKPHQPIESCILKSVQFADQSQSRSSGIQLHTRILTTQPGRVYPDVIDSGIESTSAGHKCPQPVYLSSVNKHLSRKKHLTNAHARLTDTRTKNLMITIKMFVSVTVVFIISFLPSYLIQYGILPIPRTFAFTYYLNHIANPIIYFSFNRTYRQRARKLLIIITPCLWRSSPSTAAT